MDRLIAAQDAAMQCPAFQPRGGKTYCNQGTLSVASKMNAPLGPLTDSRGNALLANVIAANLAKSGSGYREVGLREAQELANAGELVIAAWVNSSGPGHLATVRPNRKGVERWPLLANIGTFNRVEYMNWVWRSADRANVKFYTPSN